MWLFEKEISDGKNQIFTERFDLNGSAGILKIAAKDFSLPNIHIQKLAGLAQCIESETKCFTRPEP
jgi:hypothetical protein